MNIKDIFKGLSQFFLVNVIVLSLFGSLAYGQKTDAEKFTVYNPKSWIEPFNAIPINKRLNTLEGKTIVVMVDPAYKHDRQVMVEIRDELIKKYPKSNIQWIEETKPLRRLKVSKIDGLVVGAGT
ncbi:MAG TPA: hypothetical protein PK874_10050 [Desulfobacteraceae bacterium]|nr:hypothetical protein [Desulfobacteraceae bacterium]HPJ68830.1 hypothetical protein [Desulfobacteraceae bacterium]HPQ26902.1 hypothetical protein [Desulfobacteraceae bacterium]